LGCLSVCLSVCCCYWVQLSVWVGHCPVCLGCLSVCLGWVRLSGLGWVCWLSVIGVWSGLSQLIVIGWNHWVITHLGWVQGLGWAVCLSVCWRLLVCSSGCSSAHWLSVWPMSGLSPSVINQLGCPLLTSIWVRCPIATLLLSAQYPFCSSVIWVRLSVRLLHCLPVIAPLSGVCLLAGLGCPLQWLLLRLLRLGCCLLLPVSHLCQFTNLRLPSGFVCSSACLPGLPACLSACLPSACLSVCLSVVVCSMSVPTGSAVGFTCLLHLPGLLGCPPGLG